MPAADPGSHALYPGSFDVFTNGHLDILERASRMFSKVTIAVAENPSKGPSLFEISERLAMLRVATAELHTVEVCSFGGLTVEFARSIGASIIIRGLRAVSDFEFEMHMAMMNGSLAPEISTIFLPPAPKYSFLSSTLVREIARFGGDISPYVPPNVAEEIRKRRL